MKLMRREFRELGQYSVEEVLVDWRTIKGPPP